MSSTIRILGFLSIIFVWVYSGSIIVDSFCIVIHFLSLIIGVYSGILISLGSNISLIGSSNQKVEPLPNPSEVTPILPSCANTWVFEINNPYPVPPPFWFLAASNWIDLLYNKWILVLSIPIPSSITSIRTVLKSQIFSDGIILLNLSLLSLIIFFNIISKWIVLPSLVNFKELLIKFLNTILILL